MKKFVLLICIVAFYLQTTAQVAINSENSGPDPSAMLDVKSSDKGLLPPRMTHAAIKAIPNPANGLIIFCTDCGIDGNGAFFVFFGDRWNTLMICSSPDDPAAGAHVPFNDQIIWNWNPVTGASGYRWNTTNNYGTSTDNGNLATRTETGLVCNTAYQRFIWAYNNCGISTPVMLTMTTSFTAPVAPVAAIHEAFETQIKWKWYPVPGASGYKWSAINDYSTAQLNGADTTKTETGLSCNTNYERYLWSYDSCGRSDVTILTQATNFNLASPEQGIHAPAVNQIVWNWTTVPQATGYKWNTEDNYATALELGTLTSKTETGLACNTAYARYVWAYNNCGHSLSSSLNQTTILNPTPPVVATHLATSSQIIWNWNAVQGATGYKWSATDNFATAIDMGTGLTRTENNLECDSLYTRYLWSYNSCGNSNAVTLSKSTLANPVSPSQGTHTAALTSIIWRWNAVTGAIGYKWGMTNNIDEAIDMGTSLMLMESGLTCNTVYNRYVWSYNACGNSTVTTLSQSTTFNPIAAPTAGTQVASANQIVWNWNAVTNATGYKWGTTNNYTSATDMGTSLTKTETGLVCNTPYTRYVWAYRNCGTSTSVILTQSTTMNLPTGITISASANPVCAGTSVTFTATPANGGTTPAYQWKLNGNNINGATNVTYTFTPITSDKISCRLTSSLACAVNSPALSNEITMTVNPVLVASVSITASANPVCSGTTVTFTAAPANGGSTPAYQWKVNGTSVSGATNAAYSYAPASNHVVTCVLTSNAICVTGSPATSNTLTMTVNPLTASPTAGTHTATQTQITWNWNTSANATGYKWNTTNNYGTATDMGTVTTK
ncbi:MAG: PKD domain-containing protein, partial [Bacteroidetes bacterium]|nr:PKD domain-containing protein [Bacteroidota bacterium]